MNWIYAYEEWPEINRIVLLWDDYQDRARLGYRDKPSYNESSLVFWWNIFNNETIDRTTHVRYWMPLPNRPDASNIK